MDLPKISIITISYNSELTIEETIKSIISQPYENKEYIIIDGGSSDHTLDIIQKYRDKIAVLVSEKDRGISDAFNKGISMSSGDLIGIINSDDLLYPDALSNIAACYDGLTDVYRGNIIIWNDRTQFRCREVPSMAFPTVPYFIHVSHQGTFITPKAYKEYGLFNLNYRFVMDLDLLTRFYKRGAKFKYINADLALFRIGGVTAMSLSEKKDEMKSFIICNGGNMIQSNLYWLNMRVQDCLKNVLNLFGDDIKRRLRYRKYK